MNRAALRVALACLLPAALGGCGAGTLPAVHSEAERLELAHRMTAKQDYIDAISLLKTYITNNAGSADVDHALYLLGDCELKNKEYSAAEVDFDRLLKEFPESDSSGAASFRLGEALYGQSRTSDFDQEFTHKAIDQWRKYQSEFPDHWLYAEAQHRIQLARMRLADKWLRNGDVYYKMGYLEPARVYYEKIEAEYADLPELGDAWVGIALIDAKEHRKDEAIQLLKQVEQQFAGRPVAARAARERARLTH